MRCSKCNKEFAGNDLKCPYCGNIHERVNGKKFQAISKYPRKRQYYQQKTGIQAIASYYRNAFVFKGCSGRLEYWTQQLYLYILTIPVVVLFIYFLESPESFSSLGKLILIISAIVITLSSLPNISATIRRLNDAGHSDHTFYIVYVPFIGPLILFFLTIEPSEE